MAYETQRWPAAWLCQEMGVGTWDWGPLKMQQDCCSTPMHPLSPACIRLSRLEECSLCLSVCLSGLLHLLLFTSHSLLLMHHPPASFYNHLPCYAQRVSLSDGPQVKSLQETSVWLVPCWPPSWTTSWEVTPSSTGRFRAMSPGSSWCCSPEESATRWDLEIQTRK